MKLDRVDPRILVALGLAVACGPSANTEGEAESTACLSAPYDTEGPGEDSLGPCLGALPPETGTGTGTSTGTGTGTDSGGSTFGPCLDVPPPPETGTDTGPGTGSDTGTGSGTGSGAGPCLAGLAPDDAWGAGDPDAADLHDPAAVQRRVLTRGGLPADVAARLRKKG
jgi:hypothetical protein